MFRSVLPFVARHFLNSVCPFFSLRKDMIAQTICSDIVPNPPSFCPNCYLSVNLLGVGAPRFRHFLAKVV